MPSANGDKCCANRCPLAARATWPRKPPCCCCCCCCCCCSYCLFLGATPSAAIIPLNGCCPCSPPRSASSCHPRSSPPPPQVIPALVAHTPSLGHGPLGPSRGAGQALVWSGWVPDGYVGCAVGLRLALGRSIGNAVVLSDARVEIVAGIPSRKSKLGSALENGTTWATMRPPPPCKVQGPPAQCGEAPQTFGQRRPFCCVCLFEVLGPTAPSLLPWPKHRVHGGDIREAHPPR